MNESDVWRQWRELECAQESGRERHSERGARAETRTDWKSRRGTQLQLPEGFVRFQCEETTAET